MTNAFIVLAPANMFNPDGKPSVPLPKFSKHLHGTESNDEQGSEGVTLRLGLHQQVPGTSGLLGRGRQRSARGGPCRRVQNFSSSQSSGGARSTADGQQLHARPVLIFPQVLFFKAVELPN